MEKKRFLNGVKFAVALVLFAFGAFFTACNNDDVDELIVSASEVAPSPDTITVKEKTGWNIFITATRREGGDTLDIIQRGTRGDESFIAPGKAVFQPKKSHYEITEDQESVSPEFANKGMTIARMEKQEVTDTSWVNYTEYLFPAEDGNIWIAKVWLTHLKNKPEVRVYDSEILSFINPLETRSMFKLKDSPLKATDKLYFESVGADNDTTFNAELIANCERDVMAKDDIASRKVIEKGFKVTDITSDLDSLIILTTMKSKETKRNPLYITRHREFGIKKFDPREVKSFEGYGFSKSNGLSVIQAEKELEESAPNWRRWHTIYAYTALATGPDAFTWDTYYTLDIQRLMYDEDEWNIHEEFPYIIPEVKEEGTYVDNASSDRADYDKATLRNRIMTTYHNYDQPLAESIDLYKKQEVQDKVVDEDWDYSYKKEEFTPTSYTAKGIWVTKYLLGKVERDTVSHTEPISVTPESNWTKEAADNSQQTEEPSVESIKKTSRTSGEWSWDEEVGTITYGVLLNGNSARNQAKYTAPNRMKVTRKGKTLEFSEWTPSLTKTASVGSSSSKNGYTEYPYTSNLKFQYGKAVQTVSLPGTIKVKEIEEDLFFPPEWGSVKGATVTVSPNEDRTHCVYGLSVKFAKGTLPVFIRDDADAPEWNFANFEYDTNPALNGAYWIKKQQKVVNCIASDEEDALEYFDTTGKKGIGMMRYDTAKEWDARWDKGKKSKPSVFTDRFKIEVKDGALFIYDNYRKKYLTDKNVNSKGGWK